MGLPVRLFTTNQWVTDDTPLTPAETLQRLRRFNATGGSSVPSVSRYLKLTLTVFAPQARNVIMTRARRMDRSSPALATDRRTALLSQQSISLHRQLRDLDRTEEN